MSYRDLLQKLGSREPPIFIMGGYAEDALLAGKTTRPHDDVDVVVFRKDLEAYLQEFQSWGFKDYDLFLSDPSGNPTVLNCRVGDVALELCISDLDADGRCYYDLYGEPDDTRYRIFLPGDAFHHPASEIDGVIVHTVSPLTLYQIRAALDITQSFGGMRPKDVIAQATLRQRFFADKDDQGLRPRIEKLP